MIADKIMYLQPVIQAMQTYWPDNRTVNIVCAGHSVPAGYFATPFVNTVQAYPQRVLQELKVNFPYAVLNVITTAIGGENSIRGASRFVSETLCHRPDVVTIDYGLNDRGSPYEQVVSSWRHMIESSLEKGVKLLLLTPSWDENCADHSGSGYQLLCRMREMIIGLADSYNVGLCDTFAAYERHFQTYGNITGLLSWVNHPSSRGHDLICETILEYFPPYQK